MSNICTCQQPQFFIPHSAFAFNEKAAYIDSILKVLMESRFGFDCTYELFVQLSDRPEPAAAPLYDLCDEVANGPNGLTPCYALSPLGRAGYQAVKAAYQRAKQMGLVDASPNGRNSPAALTPNQGRGSP